MQAIILAGGSAMPLRPLTARVPRSMAPLVNVPLVVHQINMLRKWGVSDVILCIDHLADHFERYFSQRSINGVSVALHRDDHPRGTAGALKRAQDLIVSDEIVVLNGHIITSIDIADLIEFHRKNVALATLALTPSRSAFEYGVALTDNDGRVVRWVEKPSVLVEAPTDTINAGVYVIKREVLDEIPQDVEYSLERNLFPKLVEKKQPVYGKVSNEYWQDIRSLTDYRIVTDDILSGKLPVEIVGAREGEKIWVGTSSSIHPTADISGEVVIGQNVSIGRNAKLRGPLVIGSHCRIGDGAVVDHSIIWRGSIIEPKAMVRNCILGDDCVIKEGAAVQEGSVVGDGAVIASYLASLVTDAEAKKRGKIKFGTDGWRGIIGDDFTGENVRLVSQAIVDYLIDPSTPGDPVVVIGYDRRSQSEYFAQEAAAIVASSGLKAVFSDRPCSSPAVSYMVKYLHARGGIMVTASHNPPSFNGLKVKAYYGGSASPSIISDVEKHLHRLIVLGENPVAKEGVNGVDVRDFRPYYLGHLASLVDLAKIKEAGQKIVVDPMHGSGAGYLSWILERGGITDSVEIRSERNPWFGGVNPEPIERNMGILQDSVRKLGADVGICLDGDADRVGAVDSSGKFVDCHRIFAVLLRHLVETRKWSGGVVKTVSTTRMIDKLCEKYRLTLFETPIGFKHICDLMLQEDILIGGEESGGIGVKNHIPERDGVLMGLLILEAMAYSGKRFEELIDDIMAETGVYEYGRVDLHPAVKDMHKIISSLQSIAPDYINSLKVENISRKDGTKINFVGGAWLLLRPSGTEPVVRVYAEAPTQDDVQSLLSVGQEIVNTAGE
jgi:phosphomannomutase/NDP-sugar pyrophosphorylase family protein